jgi:hypothetical protein
MSAGCDGRELHIAANAVHFQPLEVGIQRRVGKSAALAKSEPHLLNFSMSFNRLA